MSSGNFDLKALYTALDSARQSRGLSWAAATREINRFRTSGHSIAASTVTGLATAATAEGDGVLQMLLWLERTPESFVPGLADADAERYRLPEVKGSEMLRWDSRALHAALDTRRQARSLTWKDAAREIGGVTPAMLGSLAKGGRMSFPGVMRIVRWLDRPAADFTRV